MMDEWSNDETLINVRCLLSVGIRPSEVWAPESLAWSLSAGGGGAQRASVGVPAESEQD